MRKPLWQSMLWGVLLDILLTGLALVIFAYFHHVMPRAHEDVNEEVPRPPRSAAVTAQPAVTESAPPAPTGTQTAAVQTPTPTPFVYTPDMDEIGSFRVKYRDKFTSGEVETYEEEDALYYKSASLNVTVRRERATVGSHTCTCYVVDFYVSDITCLSSIFAHDKFSKGEYEWLSDLAERGNAVVAINGDFAGMRENGVVIRNGHVYRKKHSSFDACAINWDGTMETYPSSKWDADTLIKNGAYHAWSFGPELLDASGKPCKRFNATDAVKKTNPRTAIGYFEPGHYCFVVVDGRSSESPGFTMVELAQYMSNLGCMRAYNLDGGESSSLWYQGKIVSNPSDGGRKISDAIYLCEFGEAAQ